MRFQDFKKELEVKLDKDKKLALLKYKTFIYYLPQYPTTGTIKQILKQHIEIFYSRMLNYKEKTSPEVSGEVESLWDLK